MEIRGSQTDIERVLARLREASPDWDHTKHPRAKDGKFTAKTKGASTTSGGASPAPEPARKTASIDEPDIDEIFAGFDPEHHRRAVLDDNTVAPKGLGFQANVAFRKLVDVAAKSTHAVSEAVKLLGQATWDALPKFVQLPMRGIGMLSYGMYRVWSALEHNVLMKGREWVHRFAVQMAHEKRLTPKQIDAIARTTATVDTALAWTANIPLAHWGIEEYAHSTHMDLSHGAMFALAKIGYFLPTASLGYAAYAVATTNPWKTLCAAWKVLRSKDALAKKHHESTHEKGLVHGPALAKLLTIHLVQIPESKREWFLALFSASFDQTHDPLLAIEDAEAHWDKPMPEVSDTDFVAPVLEYRGRPGHSQRVRIKEEDRIDDKKGVRYEGPRGGHGWKDFDGIIRYESEGWDEEKHPRDKSGRFTTFYRGTVPGSTKRIDEPFDEGKGRTFVARRVESAKRYGSDIEVIRAKPGAKILQQEDAVFWRLLKRRRPPNNNIASVPGGAVENVNKVIRAAKEAGYDAVSFSSDSDIGTVILNEEMFSRGEALKESEGFDEEKHPRDKSGRFSHKGGSYAGLGNKYGNMEHLVATVNGKKKVLKASQRGQEGAEMEVFMADFANEIGLPAPTIQQTDAPEVPKSVKWKGHDFDTDNEGWIAQDLVGTRDVTKDDLKDPAVREHLLKDLLFSFVVGNQDRNEGNFRVGKDSIHSIDFEMALDSASDPQDYLDAHAVSSLPLDTPLPKEFLTKLLAKQKQLVSFASKYELNPAITGKKSDKGKPAVDALKKRLAHLLSLSEKNKPTLKDFISSDMEEADGTDGTTELKRPREMKPQPGATPPPLPGTPTPAPAPGGAPRVNPGPANGIPGAPGAPIAPIQPGGQPAGSTGQARKPGTPPPLPGTREYMDMLRNRDKTRNTVSPTTKKGPSPGSTEDLIRQGKHKTAWERTGHDIHHMGKDPVSGKPVAVKYDKHSDSYLISDGKKIVGTVPRSNQTLLKKYLGDKVMDADQLAGKKPARQYSNDPKKADWEKRRDQANDARNQMADRQEKEYVQATKGMSEEQKMDWIDKNWDRRAKEMEGVNREYKKIEEEGHKNNFWHDAPAGGGGINQEEDKWKIFASSFKGAEVPRDFHHPKNMQMMWDRAPAENRKKVTIHNKRTGEKQSIKAVQIHGHLLIQSPSGEMQWTSLEKMKADLGIGSTPTKKPTPAPKKKPDTYGLLPEDAPGAESAAPTAPTAPTVPADTYALLSEKAAEILNRLQEPVEGQNPDQSLVKKPEIYQVQK